MASIFEQTIVPEIDFSNFDLSRPSLLTCNFGQLIPCFIQEVLPNEIFSVGASCVVNFAPMVAPMYQDVNVSMHFFYSPNRVVFDDFETFITGAVEGYPVSEDKLPKQPGLTLTDITDLAEDRESLELGNSWQGTLLDYFDLPNNLSNLSNKQADIDWSDNLIISDIPLRDYFKIWFDYYRDENLQAEWDSNKLMFDNWRAWRSKSNPIQDGAFASHEKFFEFMNYLQPRHRAYRKDYFTACLPSPQKGEAVSLSLSGNAPVSFPSEVKLKGIAGLTGLQFNWDSRVDPGDSLAIHSYIDPDNLTKTFVNAQQIDTLAPLDSVQGRLVNPADNTPIKLEADLSKVLAVNIERLREAFAVQEILESLSMRGSRYTEFLKGNFGVTPDDYKLQRPQFLGGLVTPVQVQQVLQQSGYSGTDQRDMTGYAAGRAFAGVGGRIFRQRFKEHGYIIGILSIMPKAYYYQGIPRHFLRHDRFDYYLPQTAHLGEQGVYNMELYFDNQAHMEQNEQIFGYIPRWAEYKTAFGGIHGDFRGNLNYYHMARTFSNSSKPTLSEEFILTKNVPTRPFAVWQSENPTINHLCWVNCYFKVIASRPMPYHSVPKVL